MTRIINDFYGADFLWSGYHYRTHCALLVCPIPRWNFILAIEPRGESEFNVNNDELQTNIEANLPQLRMNQQHGLIK